MGQTELNVSQTAVQTPSIAIIIPAATYIYLCWTLIAYIHIYFKPYWGLESLTSREPLEAKVKVSLLFGHSGDSILWSKTEVRLCGFL